MTSEITVERVIAKLPSRFSPENAADLEAVFQFQLEDSDNFYIAIEQQQCQVTTGDHPDPSITLILDSETFIKVVTGEQDGMSAFMKGLLRAEGNVILATRLGKLFKREKQSQD